MYIMAELEAEILLFTLKYRSNDGLLLIYPDLNSIEANPYLIEINADSRNLYQCAIENLSADSSNDMAKVRNDIEVLANKVSWNFYGKCKFDSMFVFYMYFLFAQIYFVAVRSVYSFTAIVRFAWQANNRGMHVLWSS